MRINVLTAGFTTSNGSAFLFPLVIHKQNLKEANLHIRFVNISSDAITDCDVLCIESKTFLQDWPIHPNYVLDKLKLFRDSGTRILYFDTTDSSGTIQSAVLPHVEKYFKSQLLIDKARYAEQIYGGRIWAEYYKNTVGIDVEVGDAVDTPVPADEVHKLGVSWNSGLADYSTYGPWKIALYQRLRIPLLLRHPNAIASPTSNRSNDLSARFGATYSRATVRYQREQIRKILVNRLTTEKLGRRGYMKELNNSKVVLSPFGWGEITLKDFEVFLTGGMLIKPSMDHLQTWPNFYEKDVTYLPHNWDLHDLNEQINWAIENESTRLEIAVNGQQRYIEHTSGPNAGELFVNHLSEVLSA